MLDAWLLSLNLMAPMLVQQPVEVLNSGAYYYQSNNEFHSPEQLLQEFMQPLPTIKKDLPVNLGYQDTRSLVVLIPVQIRSHSEPAILEWGYPLTDEIELWLIRSDGKIEPKQITGDMLDFSQRSIQHRSLNLAVQLESNKTNWLLMRISTNSSQQLPIRLYTQQAFAQHIAKENLGFGIYYGSILIMLLVNTLITLYIRSRAYVYYICYLSLYLLFQMSLNGTFFQYFLPQQPQLANLILPVFAFGAFTFVIQFARNFMDLGKSWPLFDKIFSVFLWLSIFGGISPLFLPYRATIYLLTTCTILFSQVFLIVAIRGWINGYRPARLFLCGWLVFLFGMIAYSLKTLGVLPYSFLTEYAIQIGSGLEVALLSLALGDRIQILQRNSEKDRQELKANQEAIKLEIQRNWELKAATEQMSKQIESGMEQLVQAEKLSLLGQMVAGIAHDLASPAQLIDYSLIQAREHIISIDARLKLLLAQAKGEEAQKVKDAFQKEFGIVMESLSEIKVGTNRINDVQAAIRNQTRIDRDFRKIQLKPLLDECITILRSRLKNWQLQLVIDSNLEIEVRRSQLGQVLTNLLANAGDSLQESQHRSQNGRYDIILRAFVDAGQPGMVCIEIEDDGPGVETDKVQHLFEAFFTTKTLGKGTGLGLSICRKIIEAHHGTIELASTRQLKGACFRLYLPIKQEDQHSYSQQQKGGLRA